MDVPNCNAEKAYQIWQAIVEQSLQQPQFLTDEAHQRQCTSLNAVLDALEPLKVGERAIVLDMILLDTVAKALAKNAVYAVHPTKQ